MSRRNAIPAELRELDQWVGWRWEQRAGDPKPTKPPYTADGSRKAKCNDPTTWAPFEVVCAGVDAGKLDGVGFQVKESDPYVGVDLDHCRDSESGVISTWAQEVVDRYDSYSEVSPSGTGIRIFIKAVKPGSRCREGAVEIYNRDRFFTVTGRHLAGAPLTIEERQAELDAHYAELFPAKPSVNGHASRGAGNLTAYEIIEHARQASNAAHWDQLMRGDLSEYGGDQSRADAALCALAAFYTRDPSTVDQIVRMSGLCRPKWTDRADYRERTIDGALSLVSEVYVGGPPGAVAVPTTSEQRDQAHEVPWQTAAEIAAGTSAEVDWLWRDYLAAETVVELDGKLKSGKTTFNAHLIAALLDGKPFLGRPTQKTPVVYLTEEGNRTFRSLLVRARLTARADLHILSKRRVPGLDWEQLVEVARAKLVETGARVLYVDTLGKLAGFKDDEENSAGKAATAMNPLQALASELKIVVVCNRHDRKSGGEVGESARGSSAIGGDVDVILQISRVGGQGREKRRCLRAVGRFDETPAELTIELTDDGYQEVSGTEARDLAASAVLAVLPELEEDAVALVDLLDDLKEAGHNRSNVYAGADLLIADGRALKGRQKGPSGHLRNVCWQRSSNRGDVPLDDPFLISSTARSSNEQDAQSKRSSNAAPYKGQLDVGRMRPVDVNSLDVPEHWLAQDVDP